MCFSIPDINECQSFPCLNNGACNDLINAFSCTCPPGYTGTICDIGKAWMLFISIIHRDGVLPAKSF